MSLRGWETLSCPCGNKHFQQAYVVSWHEQHGTTTKPDGWTCTGCGRRSDTGAMISVAKERVLEEKIKELQAQR